jgi:hypothetical protein
MRSHRVRTLDADACCPKANRSDSGSAGRHLGWSLIACIFRHQYFVYEAQKLHMVGRNQLAARSLCFGLFYAGGNPEGKQAALAV